MISLRGGSSAPAGYRFPREVIAVAVRWYLRYGVSYRDVEELLAERGIEVDHVTAYRWVQTFTPEFIDAARPSRHSTGDRGSSTRPTSRSPAGRRTCTGRSTSMGR
jgi:transposase-like protein